MNMTYWNKKYANMSLAYRWCCRDNDFMTNFTNIQQPACAVSPVAQCATPYVETKGDVWCAIEGETLVAPIASSTRWTLQTLRRALSVAVRATPQHGPSTAEVSRASTDGIRPPMP